MVVDAQTWATECATQLARQYLVNPRCGEDDLPSDETAQQLARELIDDPQYGVISVSAQIVALSIEGKPAIVHLSVITLLMSGTQRFVNFRGNGALPATSSLPPVARDDSVARPPAVFAPGGACWASEAHGMPQPAAATVCTETEITPLRRSGARPGPE